MYTTHARSLVQPGALAVSGPIIGGPRPYLGATTLPIVQDLSSAPGMILPSIGGIPWYVLAGLAALGIFYFGVRAQPGITAAGQRVRRARAKTIPAWHGIMYAAGAGGLGYMIGKATK